MANRFYSPDQQFLSNTGVPYAGGQLFFYATGTSTPLNTYSNQALTIANTNPVILDSNGQAGSIFLQNLAYKVVLEDVNNNQIWTMDPVYTSDYSAFAQFQPYNGNPNGNVAGTAGTVGALPGTSAVWDYVDDILYVCTASGNAASAVWFAVNGSSSTAAIVPTPQGYLTLNSDPSNPVQPTDISAATAVYYTPFVGNQIPVYNGSSYSVINMAQLTLTLTATQAGNTIYDCFVFNNSGVLTLVAGPAWNNSTAGSSARGTGASTTQLQRLNGIWVNAVQITAHNGGTTYTIAANTATYVGSILMDPTAGQVTSAKAWGQNRKWGVWNAYNRKQIIISEGDSTASWTQATLGQANAAAGNNIVTLIGLPEELIDITYYQNFSISSSGTIQCGIGINSTTVPSGTDPASTPTFTATSFAGNQQLVAYFTQPIGIGTNTIIPLTRAPSGGVTSATGTIAGMYLKTVYMG